MRQLALAIILTAPVMAETFPPAVYSLPLEIETDARALGFRALPGTVPPVTPGAALPVAPLPLASTPALGMGSDRDAAPVADSYEGETGAASTNGILVGASNHLYPKACNAAAAPGTFGDCGVLVYATRDGTHFSRVSLPRDFNWQRYQVGFDPAIDYDKSGNFYATYGLTYFFSNGDTLFSSPGSM